MSDSTNRTDDETLLTTLRTLLTELRNAGPEKELTEEVRCYSEEEAAEYLGISAKTLSREREAGRISGKRVRGQIRYTHSQLRRYINTRESV